MRILYPSPRKFFYAHYRIAGIAIPAMLAQITLPLLGLVDTAMMGHFASSEALSAVAIGTGLYMILANSAGFLRSSTLGFVAQSWGAGDWQGLQIWFLRSMVLASAISILLVALSLFALPFLPLIGTTEIDNNLNAFLRIRLWGMPAYLFNLTFIGVMLGCQNSRAVLFVMLLTNMINMILDYILVALVGMKADGVALATVVAEYIGAGYGLWLVHRILRAQGVPLVFPTLARLWGDFLPFKRLLSLNLHFFIRSTLVSLCFAYLPIISASLGTEIAAANAVMLNLWFMTAYTLDGVANAAESLCGRAIGRRMPRLLKIFIVHMHLWCIPLCLISLAIFAEFWDSFILLQTSDIQVQFLAYNYRHMLYLALLIAPWCILLDGVYYGATLGREVSSTMIAAAVIYFSAMMILPEKIENTGIWAALLLLFFVRGAGLYFYLPHVYAQAIKQRKP